MKNNRVGWFEIYVQDMNRAKAFYENVFATGGGGTLVYSSCEDCATEAARVVPAGGGIFKEKFSIGQHGFIALVTDTEGNMIGLHSMK